MAHTLLGENNIAFTLIQIIFYPFVMEKAVEELYIKMTKHHN